MNPTQPNPPESPSTPEPPLSSPEEAGQGSVPKSADEPLSRWGRFKQKLNNFRLWYTTHKKLTVPLSLLIIILILAAVPFTRYKAAGLVLKKNFTVALTDSESGSPVSGALVSSDGQSAKTDGTGKASLHLPVGPHIFSISKKYYQDSSAELTVPILSEKSVPIIKLIAIGRQVSLRVTNLITQQPLADVSITVAGTDAKTDQNGQALLVVPSSETKAQATLTLAGYNSATVNLSVSDKQTDQNSAQMTPAGQVYFLSRLSGTVDVVKTNLDGTGRKTVLAGTGNEDPNNTMLLPSSDWKYLALISKRAGGSEALYLISTANDQLSTIDSTDATYSPVGWSGDNFVYSLTRSGYQPWQPHAQALKSYSATSKQLLSLDQTNASGTSSADYAQENYGQIYLVGSRVIYEKQWFAPYSNPDTITSDQAGIYSIGVDGTGSQTLKSFAYASGKQTNISSVRYQANEIYYQVSEEGTTNYYVFSGGSLSTSANINSAGFEQAYQSVRDYLLSPSGMQTFWAESRDGKNTLFIGAADGTSGKQIATLSDYTPYGWFSDNYLLVSKNSSELYVMSKSGSQPAVKISDYTSSSGSYGGYGG